MNRKGSEKSPTDFISEDESEDNGPVQKLPSVTIQKVFSQISDLLGEITTDYPEITLKLYCQSAQVIDKIVNKSDELEEIAYDFISNSLIVYQDELSDSDEKLKAIKLIVSTISHLECFDNDNYDTLASNAAQY